MKRGIAIALCAVALVAYIVSAVLASYDYDRAIGSYWSLSEKASSLDTKAQYLDKFVGALQSADLADNDALFLRTPDNSREQNMTALLSLQKRMHEIQTMDVRSFEYQQAIAQITAQEQGEARQMLDVFSGCWYLRNHPMLWDWIFGVPMSVLIVALIGLPFSYVVMGDSFRRYL